VILDHNKIEQLDENISSGSRALAGKIICEPGILVCRAPDRQPLPYGITTLPWHDFSRWIAE